jgi:hypothetical protein
MSLSITSGLGQRGQLGLQAPAGDGLAVQVIGPD